MILIERRQKTSVRLTRGYCTGTNRAVCNLSCIQITIDQQDNNEASLSYQLAILRIERRERDRHHCEQDNRAFPAPVKGPIGDAIRANCAVDLSSEVWTCPETSSQSTQLPQTSLRNMRQSTPTPSTSSLGMLGQKCTTSSRSRHLQAHKATPSLNASYLPGPTNLA